MLRLVRLPRAEDDLIQIWRYIAEDNEAAADRLLDHFEEVLRKLVLHPEAGRQRPDLADGLRSFAAGNYVLFYIVMPPELVVVRVLSRYLDIGEDDFQAN